MPIRRLAVALGAPALLLLLAAAAPAAGLARTGAARVAFTGKGPGGVKVVGTTGELALADDGSRLTFRVPLDTLETGLALRDQHMREKYLETQKHPLAVLVVPRAAAQVPAAGETRRGEGRGQLTLHGVTREVPVRWTAQRQGAVTRVSGGLRLDAREFGIAVPSYLGVTVKPDIEVEVSFDVASP